MRITNHFKSIQKVFIDYPRLYEQKKKELEKVSGERQDLLHILELGKLDAIKLSKIARELKDVQIKRRQIKNNLEVLNEIKRFVNQFEKRKIRIRDINNIINRIEHIATRERNYRMRVRTDLQDLIE